MRGVVSKIYHTGVVPRWVNVAIRMEDGTRQVITVKDIFPYFFVPKTAHIPQGVKGLVAVDDKTPYVGIDGTELKKIVMERPGDVADFRRDFVQTYEADIRFVDRVRYDLGIKNWVDVQDGNITPIAHNAEPNFRVLFLDIEVSDENGFASPDMPTQPVLCIAMYDTYTSKYMVLTTEQTPHIEFAGGSYKIAKCKSEHELINKFVRLLALIDPDIITGWNVENYDIAYLSNRHGLKFDQYVVFDLMKGYRKLHEGEVRSYSLDYIAKSELGVGKVKREDIMQEYKNGTLSNYCLNDVKLCVDLDNKLGIIKFHVGIAMMAGCKIEDTLYNSRVVDAFTFHEVKGRYIQHTTSKQEEEGVQKTGATVYEPVPGRYEWVAEVDNASEYPNIMLSWNISPDRKTGLYVFPKMISGLLKLRKELKDKMKATSNITEYKILDDKQRVVKFLINSFAGVLGSEVYRNFDSEMFNTITSIARKHLEWNRQFFEHKGYRVLYGDTDSVYVHIGTPNTDINALINELNSTYDDFYRQNGGTGKCYLSTKLEDFHKVVFFTAVKKRYACMSSTGKIKVRGFEVRRSNTAEATVEVQYAVLKGILEGKSVDELNDFVGQYIDAVKAQPQKLAIPASINKTNYKVQTQAMKACTYSNQHFGKSYGYGSKFVMYFVKGLPTDVIALDHDEPIPEGVSVDVARHIERAIIQPLKPIFEILGGELDEIYAVQKQTTRSGRNRKNGAGHNQLHLDI